MKRSGRTKFVLRLLAFATAAQLSSVSLSGIDKGCLKWFREKVKVHSPETCERDCAIANRGMDSFSCTECEAYCEIAFRLDDVPKPEIYTPLLNTSELKLVTQEPSAAWKVYQGKKFAEDAAKEEFGFNNEQDESDALRHFSWAARITRDIGTIKAEDFLDAHEAGGDFNNDSTAMDLANNRAGILYAQKMGKKLTDEQIISEALKRIEQNKLVILRRRRK